MGGTLQLILSVTMLGVFALAGAGLFLIVRQRDRTRAALMLVMAAVLLANVLILAWPARR